jgi:hypothetical protein
VKSTSLPTDCPPASRPKLVLHAGTHKTGTTAIQSFLANQREALAKEKVLYPTLDGDPLSHTSLQKHIGLACTGSTTAPCDATLAELQLQIADVQPSKVILSSEHFFAMPRDWIAPLLAAVRPLFSSVSVVIYLRSQRDLWVSLYNQRAKALKVLPSHRLWGSEDYLGPAIVENMFYADFLDAFADQLGRQHVTPRLYDIQTLPGGDVLPDFLTATGLETLVAPAAQATSRNPSLGWKGVALALALATRYQSLDSRQAVVGALRRAFRAAEQEGLSDWLGATPCYLTEDEQRAIRDTYTASNTRLADTYSLDFDAFLLETPRPCEHRRLHHIDPAELRQVHALIRDQLDAAGPASTS